VRTVKRGELALKAKDIVVKGGANAPRYRSEAKEAVPVRGKSGHREVVGRRKGSREKRLSKINLHAGRRRKAAEDGGGGLQRAEVGQI